MERKPARNIFTRFDLLVKKFFSSSWPAACLIFALAFFIRLEEMLDIPRRWLAPDTTWELDSIAISLVKTGQFADPYMIQTGPTAHLPPLYPWLVSLIYRTFGLTESGGFARYIFMILIVSVLYALLPYFGEKLGLGKPAGFIAGLIGAWQVDWAGHGEFLTGIMLGLLLIFFLRRWTKPGATQFGSILLGGAIGLSFHLQPALLPVIAGCIVFEFWWNRRDQEKWLVGPIILGIILVSIPWAWRNYQVFGEVTFIRSNFGLELRMGNHEGAVPTMEVMDTLGEHRHPRSHIKDAMMLRDLGEIEYMRHAKIEAWDWIKSNPGEFLRLGILRFVYLWAGPLYDLQAAVPVFALTILAGLGLWLVYPNIIIPQRAIFIIPLLTYPFIYYFMAYMPRYRIPIDWILYLLAGFTICHIINKSWDFVSANLLQSNIGE